MKLQVFCRGSVTEGLGHLLRTRTLVRQAQEGREVEVIAVVEPELEGLFAGLGCPVRPVRSEGEAIPLVREFRPDVLAFDTTAVGAETFRAMQEEAFLTCSISPVFSQMAGVDVLFTRQAQAAPWPGVKVYGGLAYAIFNDHCEVIDDAVYERNLAERELPVAVCMGGADAANKTLAVLRALAELESPATIWVLLGEGYSHSYNALVEAMRGRLRHEVILAKTNRSMWRVMGHGVVGVMAGGLTTVEAIYAGLPTINLFDQAAHAELLAEQFEQGVCLNGGLFSEASLGTMVNALRGLSEDRDRLREMRRRTRGLLDRGGAGRVLRAMESELLRKALHGARTVPGPVAPVAA